MSVRGIALLSDGKRVGTPAGPTVEELDRISPDRGILVWDKDIHVPMGVRVAIPSFARGGAFTCSLCRHRKVLRDDRIRDRYRQHRHGGAARWAMRRTVILQRQCSPRAAPGPPAALIRRWRGRLLSAAAQQGS
jgi:hypothetical protein